MSTTSSKLEKTVDYTIDKNPHSKELLQSFKPIILERNRLIETLELKNTDYHKIDKMRLQGGIPVIKQCLLFQAEDPLKDISVALINTMKQGLPALQNDLLQLENHIKRGDIKIYDYFDSYPDHVDKVINDWSAQLSIPSSTIALLLKFVARIILEKRAKDFTEFLKDITWNKGYCPICGDFPSLSMIQEQGAQRWLHCSQCGHEWRFSRVICPYCENEGQKGMTYFYVQDRDKESAFICDKCNKYLITLNIVSKLDDLDLEISAIGLIHLDIIMQEKGFTPMTVNSLNVI